MRFEKLKLQLFADKQKEALTTLDDNYNDVVVEDDVVDDDIPLDDEDVEDEDDVEDDIEDGDEDTDETDETDDENVDVDDTTESEIKFDAKQQKELNRIIKSRLERHESKLIKSLQDVAGTNLDMNEVSSASRLWGLLKENPELSKAIDQVIDQHLTTGKAKIPTEKTVSTKEIELDKKEAILDLKISDKLFSKNSDKILNWAEEQGFEVTNKKSLQLAYLAWKGSQGKVIQATQKLNEQKKQATKKAVRQKAAVQSGKSSKSKGKLDYARLSDSDVLASEGLSLFTED